MRQNRVGRLKTDLDNLHFLYRLNKAYNSQEVLILLVIIVNPIVEIQITVEQYIYKEQTQYHFFLLE